MEATYCVQDDKLRLYTQYGELDEVERQELRKMGFMWCPMQKCWAATWTPDREDAVLAHVSVIEDEDMTPAERAAARATRYERYAESQARKSEAEYEAYRRIADMIPLGQPILVGHHSERRARRDQERIERKVESFISAQRSAEYWMDKAERTLRAAERRERPDVIERRIKRLEADLRRFQRGLKKELAGLDAWLTFYPNEMSAEDARAKARSLALDHSATITPDTIKMCDLPAEAEWHSLWDAIVDNVLTPEQVLAAALNEYARGIRHDERWIAHLEMRLEYERALLARVKGGA